MLSTNKLHKEILKEQTLKLLINISADLRFDQFYLVGGTALALYLGHRESIDLDFFSQRDFPANIFDRYEGAKSFLSKFPGSIECICDDVKLMFFFFAYPRAEAIRVVDGIRLASPVDIGLMKLLALAGRVTKKDIVDLYYIDKEIIEIKELFEIYQKTYPKGAFNIYASVKQLLNKEELDKQPDPFVLSNNYDWEEIYNSVESKLIIALKNLFEI